MNLTPATRELPAWNFPRTWSEAAELAKEALLPRAPDDHVTLDGGQGSLVKDMIAVTQFAGSGLLYQSAGKKVSQANAQHPPLADSPRVALQDPLVIVPGWGTLPEKFDQLIDHLLSSGLNGDRAVYLKQGQAFVDPACQHTTEIQAQDKVFVTVFDSPLDSPDLSAPQTERAIAALQASGRDKIDVLGYSMGGLSVRKMLDGGTQKVDQVALLGTANRGTRFATLAEYVIERDIQWAMSMGGLHAGHLPAMGWLKTWDPSEPASNPRLDQLNSNLERQQANASELVSIASTGFPTLSKTWGGSLPGDGLVPAASAELPGLPVRLLDGRGNKHHGNLPHDPEVFETLTDYFGWSRLEPSP